MNWNYAGNRPTGTSRYYAHTFHALCNNPFNPLITTYYSREYCYVSSDVVAPLLSNAEWWGHMFHLFCRVDVLDNLSCLCWCLWNGLNDARQRNGITMSLISSSLLIYLAIFILALFGLLYWLTSKNFDHWKNKGIKYEEPHAFFGNVKEMAFGKISMGESLSNIYFKAKGLPYVGMFAFHKPILLIRDLDIIKSVLVKDFSHFRDRNFGVDEEKDSMVARTLFGMTGNQWKSLRVKLTPTFTSGKMKLMYQFVNECAIDLVKYLEHAVPGDEGIIEIKDALARYTTDTIASCGFGLKCNSLKDPNAEFRRMLKRLLEVKSIWKNVKFACTFFAPQLLRLFHLRIMEEEVATFLRRIVWETVEERERTGFVRRDFLDLLMQLRKNGYVDSDAKGETNGSVDSVNKNHVNGNDSNAKYGLDGEDFVAQAFVFLNAGYETSSSTLTFCLYELACHPEHQTRLREEVRDAMQRDGPVLSYETLHGLSFMDQVVQETLRLYPILPFLDRQVVTDYRFPDSNILLEKNSVVMIPLLAIQRDPQYFEEPNSFRPERFSPENKKNIPAYSNMPFGDGPRVCIGMRMGLMQVKVGLAHVINRFEFAPTSETAIPLQFDPISFLLASKGGMPLKLTKLKDAVL